MAKDNSNIYIWLCVVTRALEQRRINSYMANNVRKAKIKNNETKTLFVFG